MLMRSTRNLNGFNLYLNSHDRTIYVFYLLHVHPCFIFAFLVKGEGRIGPEFFFLSGYSKINENIFIGTGSPFFYKFMKKNKPYRNCQFLFVAEVFRVKTIHRGLAPRSIPVPVKIKFTSRFWL